MVFAKSDRGNHRTRRSLQLNGGRANFRRHVDGVRDSLPTAPAVRTLGQDDSRAVKRRAGAAPVDLGNPQRLSARKHHRDQFVGGVRIRKSGPPGNIALPGHVGQMPGLAGVVGAEKIPPPGTRPRRRVTVGEHESGRPVPRRDSD